jgi:gamma-glutamylcyclotransferase (GGCT)/AIG2-like uncharacterized protein YtfP
MPRLFVYGSLRSGEENHALLRGARFLGSARTLPRYELLDLGGVAGLLARGAASVVGELYEVADALLPELDAFEGAEYARRPVALEDGEAQTYLFVAPLPPGARAVAGGHWPPRGAREGA